MATATVSRPRPVAWGVVWTAAALVAVATAFVSPYGVIALFALVLATIVVARGEHDAVSVIGVVVLLAFAIPSPFVFTPLGGSASPAAMVALFCFWLWCMGRLAPTLGLATGRQPIRTAMWVFTATIVASVAVAFARVLPPSEAKAPFRALTAAAAALGLALLTADGVPNRRRLDRLLRWLVWGATFCGFVALLQFLFNIDLAMSLKPPGLGLLLDTAFVQERNGLRRAAGTAAHPIELAVILTSLLPLALHYALRDQKRGHLSPVVRWLPTAVIALAVPTTLSRTAVVGLVVIAVWMLPVWSWTRRITALVVTGLFIVAVQFLNAKVIETIVDLFVNADTDASITTRQSDYSSGFRIIGQHLLLGRGFKTFLPSENFFVDNEYLIHTIETGIIGLAALVMLFVVAIACTEGARRFAIDENTRDLGRSLGGAIAVIAVTFATFDALSFPLVTTVAFVLIGAAGALWRLVRRPALVSA